MQCIADVCNHGYRERERKKWRDCGTTSIAGTLLCIYTTGMNLYVAKLAAQERPCFVCSKFTQVVLTTADNSNADWFYICRSHLGDTHFCTKTGGSSSPSPKSPTKKKFNKDDQPPVESDSVSDLVASIGSAWNAWRKKDKKDEDKEKDKKDEKDDNDKKHEDNDEKKQDEKDPSTPTTPTFTTPSPPPQPIRFILQRDYYYLRQREMTRRAEKKRAGEALKSLQFPQVPKERPK